MAVKLEDNLNGYFAAQNDHDADRITACFAPDAQVRDEGRTYVGRQAVRGWTLETSAKYDITVQPLRATSDGGVRTVITKVAGNFPGSPVDLTFDFRLDQAGLIHRLEIH